MSIFDTPHRNVMPEFQRSQTVLPAVAIQRIESNLLPELRVSNLILKKDEACRFCNGIFNHTSLCEFYQGKLLLHLTILLK